MVKIPRFAFEKFPEADATLMTQMKSVGETMAIGRTFKESFQKALRGLEVGSFGFGCDAKDRWGTPDQPSIDEVRAKVGRPGDQRVWHLRYALKYGISIEELHEATAIDPWFLGNLAEIVELENELRSKTSLSQVDDALLRTAKQFGFSDRQLSTIWNEAEMEIRAERKRRGIVAAYKAVDTCAAEFEAYTPYYYSTYEDPIETDSENVPPGRGALALGAGEGGRRAAYLEDETPPKTPGQRRVMILGGGPNRIGQGIEFDYCCVHAAFALRDSGYETIMVNCNPETVSTDYDTSDKLYFEPLTVEDVLSIYEKERPEGMIVQFGGQTPLNIARELEEAGARVIGTTVDTIDLAEDRDRFKNLLDRLGLRQPASGIARNLAQARAEAAKVGFPASSGRASCSAAGRWKSATTRPSSRNSSPRRSLSPKASRCSSIAFSKTRSRSTSTQSPTGSG